MTFTTAALGHLYGIAGKADEARAVYEELKARAEQGLRARLRHRPGVHGDGLE